MQFLTLLVIYPSLFAFRNLALYILLINLVLNLQVGHIETLTLFCLTLNALYHNNAINVNTLIILSIYLIVQTEPTVLDCQRGRNGVQLEVHYFGRTLTAEENKVTIDSKRNGYNHDIG